MKPLQAIFLIPNSDPPTLHDGNNDDENWSDGFRDFVKLCLTKDVNKRPSAAELLNNEWIKNAKPNSILSDWMDNLFPLMDNWRKQQEEKHRQLEDDDYNDFDDDSNQNQMYI